MIAENGFSAARLPSRRIQKGSFLRLSATLGTRQLGNQVETQKFPAVEK
jgi:hypothetical protein